MALEIRQTLKLSQQLVMTPQLQQAIKLLQLSRLELVETINQELETNPLLEIDDGIDPGQEEVGAGEEGVRVEEEGAPVEVEIGEGRAAEEFDWQAYLDDISEPVTHASVREERESPGWEGFVARNPSLTEHLLWQLRMAPLDQRQMAIGQVIIDAINPDGYLEAGIEELAAAAGASEQEVENVLRVIQQFEPTGVGSRDLSECLMLQAAERYPDNELLARLITEQLQALESAGPKAVAKALGVGMEELAEAIGLLKSLDPKPGRAVSDAQPQYIVPDVYVYKVDEEYVIVLNDDGLPKLRISSFYRQALGTQTDPTTRQYVQNKLRSAMWLIRSIHQRQRTLYKVTASIVKFQREFLDKGIAYLRPLVLRDVAEDVGMHESTISRVTSNKYVHTPQGVFELKFFFNSSINRVGGAPVASEAVKQRIKAIIAAEDPAKPLSDQAITEILRREGLDIARRTVAKYREVLGIAPSSKRKRMGLMKNGS